MTNRSTLIGFTLTNSYLNSGLGGGVACQSSLAVLSNCVISGNSASSGGGAYAGTLIRCRLTDNTALSGNGGGAIYSILDNCIITYNRVALNGGGTYMCTLYNCTMTLNAAGSPNGIGGGAYLCNLYNSIVYYNWAPNANTDYADNIRINNTCTRPHPGGIGNITNAPQFINYFAGNYRLLPISPCIDAGDNSHVVSGVDLGGNARVANGIVDIGAYEYISAGDCEFYWLPDKYELSGAASTNIASIIYGTNCAWSAMITSAWITVLSGGTGMTSNHFVSTSMVFQVGANTTSQSRVGTIVAAGYSMTVSQKRADDPYELNNTLAAAHDITTAKGSWLSSWNGSGVLCDDDFYKIRVDAPYLEVRAELSLTNAQGDLDLVLYNSAGVKLAGSETLSNRESFVYSVSTSGFYFLKVFLYNGGGGGNCQTYDLRWSDNTPTNVQFAGLAMSSGAMFAMNVMTSTGRLYTVQYSDEILNPNWSNLPGLQRIPGLGTNQVFNTTGEASNRYFRFFHEAP
jgi:hypothetical protein